MKGIEDHNPQEGTLACAHCNGLLHVINFCLVNSGSDDHKSVEIWTEGNDGGATLEFHSTARLEAATGITIRDEVHDAFCAVWMRCSSCQHDYDLELRATPEGTQFFWNVKPNVDPEDDGEEEPETPPPTPSGEPASPTPSGEPVSTDARARALRRRFVPRTE